MSLFSNLRGIMGSLFQLGGPAGPNIKNSSGVVEARNANDTVYAIVRGGTPVGDNDLTNKQYVDTMATRTVVSAQFDGNNALPANTASEHFYVVTTTGPNATIGQLIWDDGSSVGTTVVIPAAARVIITTQAFAGGTISFSADSMYFWDVGTSTWLNVGGSLMSGAVRCIRYAVTNAASQDSAKTIAAHAIINSCWISVTTPYSAGATGKVGQAGTLNLLQDTADNLLTVAGIYKVDQDTDWGASALTVRFTVTGSPAAGAGYVIIFYSMADA